MADKRISQLIERTDIANNDVLPIVASGATTTNKVTISTIQDWMQDNLDVGVTSVGLSVPSAFSVSGSPVTTSGNITISGAGTTAQYIRGDGSLADFPSISGGGSSVSYYLNGSVNQGTIGGIAYRELSKSPILGSGTDFTINADGYIASFITDAGDPSLLQIPGGNWNFETYLSASSGGGSPTFYIELYKVNSGGTATLIASNSGTPESISLGTNINPYFSSLAVPTTTLALTDRLAIRYYVTHSGRTITLHTENSHLCQIITTFTTGLTALNGLTAQVQNFATGTSGTDFNISSASTTHTFNLPDASASARGVVTTGSQTFGGVKTFANGLSLPAVGGSNQVTRIVNIGTLHEGTASLNQIGFNSGNNIYFGKGLSNGGVLGWNNSTVRYYTLPDADGTLALASQLDGYVTLGTAQTITGSKTFNSRIIGQDASLTGSGSADTLEVTHTSGSGIAVDISKAGNGEGLRVTKTSGSGNAVTITGGNLEAPTIVRTGGTSTQYLMADGSVSTLTNPITGTGTTNFVPKFTSGGLGIIGNSTIQDSGSEITLGNPTNVIGALNGTSAVFSSSVTANELLIANSSVLANYVGVEHRYLGTLYGYSKASANDGELRHYIGPSSGWGGKMTFYTDNTERMRITSSGNVGIGTASPNTRLEVTSNSPLSAEVQRWSYNTGNPDFSLKLRQDVSSGLVKHVFDVVNNATTYSNNLVLTNGNVGIGTSSPEARLDVKDASAGGSIGMFIENTAASTLNNSSDIYFGTWGGSSVAGITNARIQALNVNAGNAATDLLFHTYSGSAAAERMRITSGGNVNIAGSPSANTRLTVNGVDNTSSTFSFVANNTNQNLFLVRNDGVIFAPGIHNLTTSSAANVVVFSDGSMARSTSSIKYKKNVEDYSKGLTEVMQMRPVFYEGISESDEGKIFAGLIAEEVHDLGLTEFVQYAEDGSPDSLAYQNMVALLIKSIQELKAEIDSLKTK